MVAGALDGAKAEEGRQPSLAERLSVVLKTAASAQEGRGFLWWPIALTLGIWAYFALPSEPAMTVVAALAGLGLLLLWLGRTSPALVILGMVALGFVLAKARAEWVGAPVLQSTTGEVKVTGRVVSVDDAARRRLTIILDVESVEGLPPEGTPRRLRLSSLAKLGEPAIGHRIAVTARLSPLPRPVAPGAFDYGRALWLDGVGGTGRIVKPIAELEATTSWTALANALLRDIRKEVGSRSALCWDHPMTPSRTRSSPANAPAFRVK